MTYYQIFNACFTSKSLNYLKYSQNNEGNGVPLDHDRRKEGADRREEQAQSKDLQESTYSQEYRARLNACPMCYCCLSLLHGLACSYHATWGPPFSRVVWYYLLDAIQLGESAPDNLRGHVAVGEGAQHEALKVRVPLHLLAVLHFIV